MSTPEQQEQAERERVARLMEDSAAVFVFGSNLAGRHGKGAALVAAKKYGAIRGRAVGLFGRSYAIPTKDANLRPLALSSVTSFVEHFVRFAVERPDLRLVVTRIGCGYAGYTDAEIAPLFADAPPNCHLPHGWRPASGDAPPT